MIRWWTRTICEALVGVAIGACGASSHDIDGVSTTDVVVIEGAEASDVDVSPGDAFANDGAFDVVDSAADAPTMDAIVSADAAVDARTDASPDAPPPLVDRHTGLDEPFIAEYLLQLGTACPNCPGNLQPRTLREISCRLSDLSRRRHVGVYREILAFQLLQPSADFANAANQTNRLAALEVVRVYAALDLTLVLSFDQPLPRWMSPQFDIEGNWCPLPATSDSSDFATLKNNVSWAIGGFVGWLRDNGIPASWIASRLYVESWNEFDAVQGRVFDTAMAAWRCTGTLLEATPDRAASLQGGVNFVLNANHVVTQQLTPSIAGTYNGLTGTTAQRQSQYLTNYYAASGDGLPNIHYYVSTATDLASASSAINAGLPATWRNRLVIGETGVAALAAGCPTGAAPSVRDVYLRDVAANASLAASTSMIAFWRTMRLVPSTACESWMGITTADDATYDSAGNNLFVALGGAAGDGTEACPP